MTQNSNLSFEKKIIFFGDSIIECFNLDQYYPNFHLINKGRGGDTVSGLIQRLEPDVISLKPLKLFILIGTNDLGDENITPNYILSIYEKLISLILEKLPKLNLFILSILPTNPTIEVDYTNFNGRINKNKDIDVTNQGLKKLLIKYSFKYIDISENLRDSNKFLKKEITEDGLHLNNDGYDILSKIIEPFLS